MRRESLRQGKVGDKVLLPQPLYPGSARPLYIVGPDLYREPMPFKVRLDLYSEPRPFILGPYFYCEPRPFIFGPYLYSEPKPLIFCLDLYSEPRFFSGLRS